jgi:hypothetical protein
MSKTRIGLLGTGYDTGWPQFSGLKDRLIGYQEPIGKRIQSDGVELGDAGLVENPAKARTAAANLRREQVNLVFLYLSTDALSSVVLPVLQEAGEPVVILILRPGPQLDDEKFNAPRDRDLMTGLWLEHCQSCSVSAIAVGFNRATIPYPLVTGGLAHDAGTITGRGKALEKANGVKLLRVEDGRAELAGESGKHRFSSPPINSCVVIQPLRLAQVARCRSARTPSTCNKPSATTTSSPSVPIAPC